MDASDFQGDSSKCSEYFHNTNAVLNTLDLVTKPVFTASLSVIWRHSSTA